MSTYPPGIEDIELNVHALKQEWPDADFDDLMVAVDEYRDDWERTYREKVEDLEWDIEALEDDIGRAPYEFALLEREIEGWQLAGVSDTDILARVVGVVSRLSRSDLTEPTERDRVLL